jgi:hypothetical protein
MRPRTPGRTGAAGISSAPDAATGNDEQTWKAGCSTREVNATDKSAAPCLERGRGKAHKAARFSKRIVSRIMRIRVGISAE